MIKLIVGLGNPGSQYEKTRHNAGFLFLDKLAFDLRIGWSMSSQFQGEVAAATVDGRRLLLLKPMTFMNRSGWSVGNVARFYKIELQNILVVHDELDLPGGVVRLKRDGGHAGHNGLKDIISHLGGKDFFRLRVGIGRPVLGASVADYVLSAFAKQELALVDQLYDELLQKARDKMLGGDVSAFNGIFADRDKVK